MIAIGQFVFIFLFIMISILFYYIKWTKKFSVLLASLPAVYFTYQIFLLGIGKQRLY